MASTPEPVAEQTPRLPDAANAAAPGHLLRTLEWRTGVEYLSARLAMRRIAGWIVGALRKPDDEAGLTRMKGEAEELCRSYPVPGID